VPQLRQPAFDVARFAGSWQGVRDDDALVELEGGARMMSRVEDVAPQAVRIGQQVSARIVVGDEPFVVFTLADGAAA